MLRKNKNAVIYGGGAIGITAQIEKLLVADVTVVQIVQHAAVQIRLACLR